MPPGPPPEPPEISLQKGTSHSAEERAKRAVLAPRSRPELPSGVTGAGDLTKRTAEIFEETVGRLVELGIDYAGDRGIIEAYAGELAMLEYCDVQMADTGFTPICEHFDKEGNIVLRAHPLIAVRRNSAAAVHRFGQALGLTPSGRASIRKPEAGDGTGGFTF